MYRNNITSATKLGGKWITYIGDKKVIIEKKTTKTFPIFCSLTLLGLIPYLLTGASELVLPFFLGSVVCSVFSSLASVLFKENKERMIIDKNDNLFTIERRVGNSIRIVNQYSFSDIRSLNIYNDGNNKIYISLFVSDGNVFLLSNKLGKNENYRQKFEFAYRIANLMGVPISNIKYTG